MSLPLPDHESGRPQPDTGVPRRRVLFNPRAVVTGALFIAIIGLAIWYLARSEPLLVQGEAESTRIDTAARVSTGWPRSRSGGVRTLRPVQPSSSSTIPSWSPNCARPKRKKTVTDAELQCIKVGARSEIIAQRKAEIDRAAADLTLAQKTYNRTKQLAADKFAPDPSSTKTLMR
jgi:HlyD family secretion protein